MKAKYKDVAWELNCSVSFLQEFLLDEFLNGHKRT